MADIIDLSEGAKEEAPQVIRTGEAEGWIASAGATGMFERALYSGDTSNVSVSLMRIEPGGDAPIHSHGTVEHLFVVSGSFSDGYGTYGPGDYIVRNPRTSHSTVSEEGATVFVMMAAA
ncbi:cupin domain-containing protein [Leucobacter sp. GX24907]